MTDNIYHILTSHPDLKSIDKITEYLSFIDQCSKTNTNNTDTIHKHHICPKAMFPEYSSLKENSWNMIPLTPKQHAISHMMLYDAYKNIPTQRSLFLMLKSKDFGKISVDKYQELKLSHSNSVICKDVSNGEYRLATKDEFESNENLVGVSKGLIVCKDVSNGEYRLATKDEFESNENLVGPNKGMTQYVDENGIVHMISVSEYHNKKLESPHKGKVVCKDKSNNKNVSVNKEELLYNENLEHINSNMVVCKDKITGEIIKVSKQDFDSNPNLVGSTKGNTICKNKITGEFLMVTKEEFEKNPDLVGPNHGMVKCRDVKTNELKYVTCEEYANNENLVTIQKGKKHRRLKCKSCGKEIGVNNIKRHERKCGDDKYNVIDIGPHNHAQDL